MMEWVFVVVVVGLLFGPVLWASRGTRAEDEAEAEVLEFRPSWASAHNRLELIDNKQRRRPDSAASLERAEEVRRRRA